MPTYEFRCPDGHEFERFYRSISAGQAEEPCPQCGKIASRQLSAGAGLVFKGAGFYLTDYGKNAHRKTEPPKQTDGKPDPAGQKTESKSESKSEGKSEAPPAKSDNSKPKPSSTTSKPE